MTTIADAVLAGEHDAHLADLAQAVERRQLRLDPTEAMGELVHLSLETDAAAHMPTPARYHRAVELYRQVRLLLGHPNPMVRSYARTVMRKLHVLLGIPVRR